MTLTALHRQQDHAHLAALVIFWKRDLEHNDYAASTIAKTSPWDVVKQMIHTLGSKNLDQSWVVMKCELCGHEGREKLVMWYPSESSVRTTLRQPCSRGK